MFFKNFKPLDWLKYFCFNFFHNKYAREGTHRSTLNFLLNTVIAFVLICGGLTIGYNCSFSKHYENASGLKKITGLQLANTELSVNDGILSADSVKENFADDYYLVVDTRPADGTFDDFTLLCKDADGSEISYDEYRKLSKEERGKYALTLKYSGKTLDTAERYDGYCAYLDGENISGAVKQKYEAAKAELSGYALYNEVYKLYVSAYYPSFAEVESYASVPTIRSYYISKINENKYDKFLLLFDEYCICSYCTDGGIAVSFSGYYNAPDGEVEDIDGLIVGAFNNNSASNFIVFAGDLIVSLVGFVIFALLVSLICAFAFRKLGLDYNGSNGIFNILGGFMPVSGIAAFLLAVALPYCLTISGAYLAVRLVFLSVIIVRFAVLVIMDIVNKKKTPAAPAEVTETPAEVEETPQLADPFEE